MSSELFNNLYDMSYPAGWYVVNIHGIPICFQVPTRGFFVAPKFTQGIPKGKSLPKITLAVAAAYDLGVKIYGIMRPTKQSSIDHYFSKYVRVLIKNNKNPLALSKGEIGKIVEVDREDRMCSVIVPWDDERGNVYRNPPADEDIFEFDELIPFASLPNKGLVASSVIVGDKVYMPETGIYGKVVEVSNGICFVLVTHVTPNSKYKIQDRVEAWVGYNNIYELLFN